ncbi:MAG TPA: short chain dehydrogenase [Candidatus Acidoferrum sp.]
MKIILIGASGTLGKAVSSELASRHEIVAISRNSGNIHADIRELNSLRAAFQKVGKVDAIVCAAGSVHFGPWAELTPEKFEVGLRDKLMGQVNVVLAGQEFLSDGGSFTLTSGILSGDPIRYGAAASLVNGALESFVRAAAIELPRSLRINIVSPDGVRRVDGFVRPIFSRIQTRASRRCRARLQQERRRPADRADLQSLVRALHHGACGAKIIFWCRKRLRDC